jgi:hypothetical protein
MIKQIELNTGIAKAFTWSVVLLILGMAIGQGLLMHFVPAPDPRLSAEEIRQKFIDRQDQIRIGAFIQIIGWTTWATWGIALTTFMRKMERGYPILTYASIALVGGGWPMFVVVPLIWGVCAYRPTEMSAQIIQFANDLNWFLWLFPVVPFGLWIVLIGVAILQDHNQPTLYPRWVGFLNVWTGFLMCPAVLIVFWKTGPFAINGVLAFWLPVVVLTTQIVVMVTMTLKLINRLGAELQAAAEAGDPEVGSVKVEIADETVMNATV